jgi:hypothetical protein
VRPQTEPWMEAKLLAVTEIELTPDSLTAPRNWRVYLMPPYSIVFGRFSIDAMDGRGNLMAVMDAMGHSRPDVTRLYQHPGLKQIGMAINKRNQAVQLSTKASTG